MREAIPKEECTDPQHSIPRPEFGGLSFHEYELEHVKLLRLYEPAQKFVDDMYNAILDNADVKVMPLFTIDKSRFQKGYVRVDPELFAKMKWHIEYPEYDPDTLMPFKTRMRNKYLPRFLRYWQAKYRCKFGIHNPPEGWRSCTSYMCFWCGHTIINRRHVFNRM